MENKTGVLIVSIFALAVIIGCGRAADKKAPGSEFRGQFKLATVTPL
jgi:hypothetical protein